MEKNLKGYKGFEKGLICRGKQYAENTVFEEEDATVCLKGMHFCVNPFDVLDHYDLVNEDGGFNDFAEVEAMDECLTDDNKKYCTKKLKVGAKLSFAGFIKACVNFVIEKTTFEESKGGSSGDYAQIGSSGDYAQIGSSGNYAQIGSSGDSAQIGSSGDYAQIGSSGNYAQIGSSGDYAVVMCAGNGSIAKAKKGSWITLAEWKENAEGKWIPVNVVTVQVDGEKIKEDTYYRLENGEFVEVGE